MKKLKIAKKIISSWKLLCSPTSHAVYPFVHNSLHASVYCKESLVQYEAPGLVSTTQSMLGPHQESSCYCPVLWRSCNFGSAGQVPSHAPVDYRWDRPSHEPGSGPDLSSCRVGCGEWGQLSHGYSFGTGSLTPLLTARCRDCSSECCSWWGSGIILPLL